MHFKCVPLRNTLWNKHELPIKTTCFMSNWVIWWGIVAFNFYTCHRYAKSIMYDWKVLYGLWQTVLLKVYNTADLSQTVEYNRIECNSSFLIYYALHFFKKEEETNEKCKTEATYLFLIKEYLLCVLCSVYLWIGHCYFRIFQLNGSYQSRSIYLGLSSKH